MSTPHVPADSQHLRMSHCVLCSAPNQHVVYKAVCTDVLLHGDAFNALMTAVASHDAGFTGSFVVDDMLIVPGT